MVIALFKHRKRKILKAGKIAKPQEHKVYRNITVTSFKTRKWGRDGETHPKPPPPCAFK